MLAAFSEGSSPTGWKSSERYLVIGILCSQFDCIYTYIISPIRARARAQALKGPRGALESPRSAEAEPRRVAGAANKEAYPLHVDVCIYM